MLCEEYLGVKPTKGNGRKYHFTELERYCEYHKEGQKIIIDNVYKDKKEKIDMRKSEYISETDKRHNGNNTFYGEDIEKLLLLMMAPMFIYHKSCATDILSRLNIICPSMLVFQLLVINA